MQHEIIEYRPSFKTVFKKDLVPSTVQKCIKNIIHEENYITYSVYDKILKLDGVGYLGIIYEVNVKGKTTKGNKEQNIFMKIIAPNEKLSLLSLSDVYSTELFVYKELSKVLTELQDEVNIPIKDRYKFVKHFDESNQDVIILENMRRKGFDTVHRMDVVTIEFAELAVKELAKFHALSLALEQRSPNYFNRRVSTIKHAFYFDDDWKVYIRNMCQMTLKHLDKDNREKLEAFVPLIFEKQPGYIRDITTRRALCHGDYRTSNILMKEIGGKITEVIPIDYQLVHYGCPILDFLYFTFTATDQKFRRDHLGKLKDLYYETLRTFLNYFHLDVDFIYPRKAFEQNYVQRLDYGLIAALYVEPFVMAKEGDVPDITTGAMSELRFKTDDRFRERMVGIVKDFIAWGYL